MRHSDRKHLLSFGQAQSENPNQIFTALIYAESGLNQDALGMIHFFWNSPALDEISGRPSRRASDLVLAWSISSPQDLFNFLQVKLIKSSDKPQTGTLNCPVS